MIEMAKHFGIKRLTKALLALGKLAFIAAIGLLAFLALVMVGNLLLWTLALTMDALLDFLKNGIFGG